MASDEYKKGKKEKDANDGAELPKHKQLIQMLSFRVVPAYYKEIEKVANHQHKTVSKLIRTYIKVLFSCNLLYLGTKFSFF